MATWGALGEEPLLHTCRMSSLLLFLGVAISQGEAFSATHCASSRDETAAAATCRGVRCAGNLPPPLLAQTMNCGARSLVPTRMTGKSPEDVSFSTNSEVRTTPLSTHHHAAQHSLFSLQSTHVLRAQARTSSIQLQQSSACRKTRPRRCVIFEFARPPLLVLNHKNGLSVYKVSS